MQAGHLSRVGITCVRVRERSSRPNKSSRAHGVRLHQARDRLATASSARTRIRAPIPQQC